MFSEELEKNSKNMYIYIYTYEKLEIRLMRLLEVHFEG